MSFVRAVVRNAVQANLGDTSGRGASKAGPNLFLALLEHIKDFHEYLATSKAGPILLLALLE